MISWPILKSIWYYISIRIHKQYKTQIISLLSFINESLNREKLEYFHYKYQTLVFGNLEITIFVH